MSRHADVLVRRPTKPTRAVSAVSTTAGPDDTDKRQRALLIVRVWPWRSQSGGCQRIRMLRDAMAMTSTVDLLVLTPEEIHDWTCRALDGYDQAHHLRVSQRSRFGAHRLLSFICGDSVAQAIRTRRYSRPFVKNLVRQRRYAVVLTVREDCFLSVGRMPSTANVVDVDDVTHVVVRRWRRLGRDERGEPLRRAGRFHSWVREVVYRAVHRYVGSRADRTVYASAHDARRAQLARHRAQISVVPNAVPEGTRAPATTRVRSAGAAIVLFQGLMLYGPNTDGAHWFVREVWPSLREAVDGGASFHIVGRHSGALSALEGEAGVSVVGEVEDMASELADAALVVVPIRVGGGTRIKILEALAAGVPVVSTSVGAEGLALRHGVDLLVADDPREFAAECARLLSDEALRNRVVAAGGMRVHELYRRQAVVAEASRLFVGG